MSKHETPNLQPAPDDAPFIEPDDAMQDSAPYESFFAESPRPPASNTVKKSPPPKKAVPAPAKGIPATVPAGDETPLRIGICSMIENCLAKQISIPETTLSALFDGVKSGKWRKEVEAIRNAPNKEARDKLKQTTLPQFEVYGVFESRKKDSLLSHSGFLCLDFDQKENPQLADAQERERAKERLSRLEYVAGAFESPSLGLKALIRIPAPESESLINELIAPQMAFLCLKIDKQATRHTLASFDPRAYINPLPLNKIPPIKEAEKLTAQTVCSLFDDVARRMYFTGKDGYIFDNGASFAELSKGDATEEFTEYFHTSRQLAKKALYDIRKRNAVAEVFETLACFPRGICELNGNKILIKQGANFIPASETPANFSEIIKLTRTVFNDDWEQITFFLSWLKLCREAFEKAFRARGNCKTPCPYLGILGTAGAGKNLLAETLIFPTLGALTSCGKPYVASLAPAQYEKEKQWLGDETITTSCARLGDDAKTLSPRQREDFARTLKGLILEPISANRKNKKAILFNAQQFFIQLGNSETDGNCANTFPLITGDFKDKPVILHISNSEAVKAAFPSANETATAREILAQLPAFLNYLQNDFQIPESIRDLRFGIKGFISRYAQKVLFDVSAERTLLDDIVAYLETSPQDFANSRQFSATEFFELLNTQTQKEIRKPSELGKKLAKLAPLYPEIIKIHTAGKNHASKYSFNPHAIDTANDETATATRYKFPPPPFFCEDY